MNEDLVSDFLESLLIVVVIYETNLSDSVAFQSLSKALTVNDYKTSVFIYDNSLNQHSAPAYPVWNIFYHHDPTNSGVSKAYNQGFVKAKELNKKWMLLVDQDTAFPTNTFSEYNNCITKFECSIVVPILKDQIGNVSPFKFYLGGGKRIKKLTGNKEMKLNDFFFINSGILISVDLFQKAGLYDENLPLDFSDMAFIKRLRKQITTFILANSICKHQLSSSSLKSSGDNTAPTLARFKLYLKSSRLFGKDYDYKFYLMLIRFFRAVKLGFKFRSVQFLSLLFQS